MQPTTITLTPRQRAIDTARLWLSQQPLYLDTETTGVKGRVVQVCVVDTDGSYLFGSLVNPRESIPAEATAIHGITNEQVAPAPVFEKVWQALSQILRNRLVIAYNAAFDYGRLIASARINPLRPGPLDQSVQEILGQSSPQRARFVCAMELYAQFYGEFGPKGYKWQTLSNAARQCGITLPKQIHTAEADAQVCRLVVEYMAEQT